MDSYIHHIIEDMKRTNPGYEQVSLSVGEVLNLPALRGYKVLAGNSGLNKRCRHIIILETPTGISWLEGGEFLLTAGYAFTNNEEYKLKMMHDAKKRGVSAIAIKENRYFGEIPQELLDQANEFGIPLILIPYEVIYTSTISSFYNMLFYRKNEYILSLNNIYEKLLDLSFENKDIDGIIYSLSNLSNSNVFLFDNHGNVLTRNIINEASIGSISTAIPFYKEGLQIVKESRHSLINYKFENSYISMYPIIMDENNLAFLCVINDIKLDRLAQNTVEYGISIISTKLERDRAARFAHISFNKTLVEIMLNNKDLPDDFYRNVERDLGWDFNGCFIGICIKIHTERDKDYEEAKNSLYEILDNLINNMNYLSTEKKSEVFIFIRIETEDDLENYINNLYEKLKAFNNNYKISIGIATPYKSIRDIEKLYNESYLAALFSSEDIIYFSSLDTIKLLYPLRDDKEVQNYYDKTIKKLERYDEEHGSNLVETLETYLKHNLKKTLTSEKLFIHVETLRYRINRIEEITGYSLDDSEGLFALQIGIKLKRLIKIN